MGAVVKGEVFEARSVERRRRMEVEVSSAVLRGMRSEDSEEGGEGEGERKGMLGGKSVVVLSSVFTVVGFEGSSGNVRTSSSDIVEGFVSVGLSASCVFASIAFSSADAFSEFVDARRDSAVWLSVGELGSGKTKSLGAMIAAGFVELFLGMVLLREVRRSPRRRSTPRRTVLRREPLRRRFGEGGALSIMWMP